jgi:hypothetical protein
MSGSNVRSDSNVRSNVRANPAKTKGSDNTDNTYIRNGDFSETHAADGADDDLQASSKSSWENDPMRFYQRKEEVRRHVGHREEAH